MILPLMAFFLMLLIFGGIATLAVVIDRHSRQRAPLPFAVFFAGVGFYLLFMIGALVGLHGDQTLTDYIAFVVAPPVGGIGGSIIGYRLGLRVRRRAMND